jgi:hypothetical protein
VKGDEKTPPNYAPGGVFKVRMVLLVSRQSVHPNDCALLAGYTLSFLGMSPWINRELRPKRK